MSNLFFLSNRCGLLVLLIVALCVTAHKLIHTTGGINQLHLTCVEGVRCVRDFHLVYRIGFAVLSTLLITFLPRSKRLLISWLQSPSAVILEPPKIKVGGAKREVVCPAQAGALMRTV